MAYETKTWTICQWIKAAEAVGYISLIPTATANFSDLYGNFVKWCAETRRVPMTEKSFALGLGWLDYPCITGSRGVKMRGGIKFH